MLSERVIRMAKLSDIYILRQEMAKVQEQVRYLHRKGLEPKRIADTLGMSEKSVRVIVRWCC